VSFAENLRIARKERGISQEGLAELLDVSRQAVSKWEQGIGYPEAEKMIKLSKILNISLDYLMCDESESVPPQKQESNKTGRIMIKSEDGKTMLSCYKVRVLPLFNRVFKCKIDEPQYVLYGIDGTSFWGENLTLLGWYANKESITKEQDGILVALRNGDIYYELKHNVKVKKRLLSIKLDE